MVQQNVPELLWGFARKYGAEILNRIWLPMPDCTPEEEVFGEMPNIFECLDFWVLWMVLEP